VDRIIGGWEMTGVFAGRSGYLQHDHRRVPVGFLFNSPSVLNGNVRMLNGVHDAGANIQFFTDPHGALAAWLPPWGIGNRKFSGTEFWN